MNEKLLKFIRNKRNNQRIEIKFKDRRLKFNEEMKENISMDREKVNRVKKKNLRIKVRFIGKKLKLDEERKYIDK